MREVPIKYAMQRRFYVYVFFFYLSNSRLPDVKEKRGTSKNKKGRLLCLGKKIVCFYVVAVADGLYRSS